MISKKIIKEVSKKTGLNISDETCSYVESILSEFLYDLLKESSDLSKYAKSKNIRKCDVEYIYSKKMRGDKM